MLPDMMGLEQNGFSDEMDPGKDLFALLFLAFFVLNMAIMLLTSKISTVETARIDTMGRSATCGKRLQACWKLNKQANGQIVLLWNNISCTIPKDIPKLIKSKGVQETDGHMVLVIANPSNTIGASELIKVVGELNQVGINVVFSKCSN